MGRKKNFKTKQNFFRYLKYFPRYSLTGSRVLVGGWGFSVSSNAFSQNNFHRELLPHKRLQLSQFCIYGHKLISQGYSIMTDNLKQAGIFRKSVYFFFMVSVLDFYILNTRSFR